jgi:hypothetical protein
MRDVTPQQKGDALESAVTAIESAIISAFPGYSESTFRIEGKKIVKVDGVRHELDVYVSVDRGMGYEATFIFECKNWTDKVGKNEIIILSEKIKAIGAQRGFFVARAYTSDAIAQAGLDPRVELLTAVVLDPMTIAVPGGFHLIQMGETTASVLVRFDLEGREPVRVLIDLKTANFELNGKIEDFEVYVNAWTTRVREICCRVRFSTH